MPLQCSPCERSSDFFFFFLSRQMTLVKIRPAGPVLSILPTSPASQLCRQKWKVEGAEMQLLQARSSPEVFGESISKANARTGLSLKQRRSP